MLPTVGLQKIIIIIIIIIIIVVVVVVVVVVNLLSLKVCYWIKKE